MSCFNELIRNAGNRYAALPQNLQQRMTFGFQDAYGSSLGSVSYPFAEVNNQRITLSFKPATQADEDALASLLPEGEITDISQLPTSIPAYLINVVPELKVGDNVVLTGNSMTPGEEITFRFTPEFAGRYGIPNTYNVIAGSYLAIAAIAGNVSQSSIEDRMSKIREMEAVIESGDDLKLSQLTGEQMFGDVFHLGLLGYYAKLISLTGLLGLKQKGEHYLAAGLGSYGYEPQVSYVYGVPKSIHGSGAVMNLPMVNVFSVDSDGSDLDRQAANFAYSAGLTSSYLEHSVPEEMFITENNPGEAISAVKALFKASEEGQRIYHITRDNQADLLPNIHHNNLVMDEIVNAIAIGKEVVTHTDAVSVPGWSGAGYVIYDPVTGDGAYKIGGGENGMFLQLFSYLSSAIGISAGYKEMLSSLTKPLGDSMKAAKLFGSVAGFAALASFFIGILDISVSCNSSGMTAVMVLYTMTSLLALMATFLAVAFLGPIGAFLIGTTLSFVVEYLRRRLVESPICN